MAGDSYVIRIRRATNAILIASDFAVGEPLWDTTNNDQYIGLGPGLGVQFVGGASPAVAALGDVGDVTIAGVVADQTIAWTGAAWENLSYAALGVLLADGSVLMTGDLNLGTNQIVNMGDGVAAQDAVTLTQLEAYFPLSNVDGGTGQDSSGWTGFAHAAGGTWSAIKSNIGAGAAPGVGDDVGDGYAVGSVWLDTTNDKAYVCLDTTGGAAVWTETTAVGVGGGDHSTLANLDYASAGHTAFAGTGVANVFTARQTFTALPTGVTFGSAPLVIDPASSPDNARLLDLGVGGVQKAWIDEDGDILGNMFRTTAVQSTRYATRLILNYATGPFYLSGRGAPYPTTYQFRLGFGNNGQLVLPGAYDYDSFHIWNNIDADGNDVAGALLRMTADISNPGTQTWRFHEWGTTADVLGYLSRGGGAQFGTSASGHGLIETAADVMISGKLEVDDRAFFDEPVVFSKEAVFDAEYDNGNSGGADTIDWGNGNKQLTSMTGDCTYTFTAPAGVGHFTLRMIHSGAGRTPVWPGTVKWPDGTEPTWSLGDTDVDIAIFYWDGVSYNGTAMIGMA